MILQEIKSSRKEESICDDLCTLQIWKRSDGSTSAGTTNTIEYHRDLYDIGLHGPDILFYYKALKSHPVNQQGHTVHENFAGYIL